MSIYTNWDPLQEVIVGDCYAPETLDKVLPKGAELQFNKILEETKEDLQNLADYLTRLKVKVHRPKVPEYKPYVDLGYFKIINPTAPVVPRDQYLAYGKTIYQTYTSMPDRYLDSVNYNHIFKEKFDAGYNWISQPPPVLKALQQDKWWANGQDIYHHTASNRILWHTATMFKCGDKLVTNTEGPGTEAGLEWMSRNLPAGTIVSAGRNYQKSWGHIDHGWFMTNDNLVFCANKSWVPEPLRNKEIVEFENLVDKFDDEKFIASYTKTGGKFTKEWIDTWLTEWKGYAQDVFFDSNVLVVDSQNVIFSNTQPKLFKMLEGHGITPHVVKQRHGLFWESGIHCMTLDLVREGESRSIIS